VTLTPDMQRKLTPLVSMLAPSSECRSTQRATNGVVPIREWVGSTYYAGVLGKKVYPFWKEKIYELFDNRASTTELILGGGLGTGKTTCGNVILGRLIYELSMYDSPQEVFGMLPTDEIYMAYLSVSIKQANRTGFGQLRSILDSIPYFQDRFARDPEIDSMLAFPKGIRVVAGSDIAHTIGSNLVCLVLDEANFLKKGSGDMGDLSKAQAIYDESSDRMITRFLSKKQAFPGLTMILSSATNQSSFTSQRIKKRSPRTMVATCAVWDTKEAGTFTDKRFYVFAGSDTVNPMVLETHDDWRKAYQIETFAHEDSSAWIGRISSAQRESLVPVPDEPELRERFRISPLTSLRNLAGVSSVPTGKFFTGREQYAACLAPSLRHPMGYEQITLALGDDRQLSEYLIAGAMLDAAGKPIKNPKAPRFVHADQGETGCAEGLAICHIDGMINTAIGILPNVVYDLILRIPAPPPPDRIALGKVPKFLRWLRSHGMQFGMVTFDQFQSSSNLQELVLDGFRVDHRSLDSNDDAWLSWSDGVYAGAVQLYRYVPFEEELFELDHDHTTRKVRHPRKFQSGEDGRSDVAEAVVGAYANALKASTGLQAVEAHREVMRRTTGKLIKTQDNDMAGLMPEGIVAVKSAGGSSYQQLADILKKSRQGRRF